MTFKDYLLESEKKTVAVLFGRMNPPTSGHEENVEGLKKLADKHNADHLVIASHSQDAKKNPLTAAQKTKHLKRAFPGTNVTTSSKEKPTIFHHLSELHKQGYQHVVIAGGSDRAEEYNRLKDYNGKEGKHGYYNFKSITTASTGERKAGVSGTDMRKHATNNNFPSFRKGLPSKLAANEKHAKEVFRDVRSGMGLHEIYDPHLKVSKYQWGEKEGTDHMKEMTPGENKKPVNSFTPLRQKIKEQKIPVLLMTAAQRQELHEQSLQLEFDGIQTKHFDMCPKAYTQFRSMVETIRAGKHIGEQTGHSPDKLPYPGASPEVALRPAEIQTMQAMSGNTPTTTTQKQVQAGIAMKPKRLKLMQMKHFYID
jgi:hypothetical protein